jgi:multiple sugar transport system permease protein
MAVLELPPPAPETTTPRPAPPASKRRPTDVRAAALLLAPALVLLALFTYLPAVLSLVASLFDVPLSGHGWHWVGIGNYESVVDDHEVRRALVNTLVYCLFAIVPSIVVGLGLALLANAVSRGKAAVSTILFLPLTANLVAMAVVFKWLFAFRGGFANQVFGLVGFGPVNFLGDGHWALPTVAAVGVWRAASFCMVLFLAGLTAIPTAIDEAAATDGLRGWAKLRHVTLPMLRPTLVLATVVATLQAVQVFDTIQVMTQGGPLGQTETLLTITWQIGFEYFKVGKAAALSFLLLVFLLIVGWLRRAAVLKEGV